MMDEKETLKNVISELNTQIETELKLVELYDKTSDLILSDSARWLLGLLQMDSRKHIQIIDMTIKILEGEEIRREDKQEIEIGLNQHMQLEKESLERAKKLIRNPLIKENPGVSRILSLWLEDEWEHHKTISQLKEEKFTRENIIDAYTRYRRKAWDSLRKELSNLIPW